MSAPKYIKKKTQIKDCNVGPWAEGQSPWQDLEVGAHSRPFLLVISRVRKFPLHYVTKVHFVQRYFISGLFTIFWKGT